MGVEQRGSDAFGNSSGPEPYTMWRMSIVAESLKYVAVSSPQFRERTHYGRQSPLSEHWLCWRDRCKDDKQTATNDYVNG